MELFCEFEVIFRVVLWGFVDLRYFLGFLLGVWWPKLMFFSSACRKGINKQIKLRRFFWGFSGFEIIFYGFLGV